MHFVHFFLLPGIILLVSQSHNPLEFKKDFYQNFEVKNGATLVLDHGNGRVEMTSWEKDVVSVQVHYHSERISTYSVPGNDIFDVHFKQKGDLITITGIEKKPQGVGVRSRRVYEYYYTIQAPKYLNLELHGRKGDVSIISWAGSISSEVSDSRIEMKNIDVPSIDIKMIDGDIDLEAIKGLLAIEAEDSEITITNCQTLIGQIELSSGVLKIDEGIGNFDIRLDDGRVELSKMSVRQMDISSEAADIDLELMQSEQIAIKVLSEEGDIHMTIDADNSAEIFVNTIDGDLDSGDIELIKEGDHYKGKIGTGDGFIQLQSREGDIELQLF